MVGVNIQLPDWAPEVIAAALAGGVVTLLITRYYEVKSTRRKLYASSYKAVMSWQEMLYRVRRRGKTETDERQLINKFHDLQEDINYYQGLISAESKSLGRSYAKFTKAVKSKNETLIQAAWEAAPKKPKDGTPAADSHPKIQKDAEAFLEDTRSRHSVWQLPKLAVWWRNRK